MAKFYTEFTDLFCGELNYSFLERYLVTAKSQLGAVQKLARYYGLNFRKYYDYDDKAIYHSKSQLTGFTIESYDHAIHGDTDYLEF